MSSILTVRPETIYTAITGETPPVLLLGAGASVKSGIPLAAEIVDLAAKWAFCQQHGRNADDPKLMRSDWRPWLQAHAWFDSSVPLVDNYSRTIERLVQPREKRREFFRTIVSSGLPPSQGYDALVGLMALSRIRTVLTTNFDEVLVQAASAKTDPRHVEIIRTSDDLDKFSTAPPYPQLIYLHGSVDHYTDRNLESETTQLDSGLVERLYPLLRDHALIVIGYRGAEPSVMTHLLREQAERCGKFRHGIYWCQRESGSEVSPLLRELHAAIGNNLQIVPIEGFDELFTGIHDRLKTDSRAPAAIQSSVQSRDAPTYDLSPADNLATGDLSQGLLQSKLVAYCDASRLEYPKDTSKQWITDAALSRGLLCQQDKEIVPTQAGALLFAADPQKIATSSSILVRIAGSAEWMKDLSHRLDPNVASAVSDKNGEATIRIGGNIWSQIDALSDILSAVNTPFRLKGPTSQDVYPYPPLALKELLTNLLAHRDYSSNESARIEISEAYVTFWNPGGLIREVAQQLEHGSIQDAIEANRRGLKGYRNPVIADFLFYVAKLMDKRGSGLPDVFTEATNNLNEVMFGPNAANTEFTARLMVRGETVDMKTRTAQPKLAQLRFSPNALEIARWPDSIHWAPTTISRENQREAQDAGSPPHFFRGERLWTFSNLRDPNNPLTKFCDTGAVSTESLTNMLATPENVNGFFYLMNTALISHLISLGLEVQRRTPIRAYFPKEQAGPRAITYRGMMRVATRTVTKPIVSKSRGTVAYWEHKAVALRFERFGGNWSLLLLPSYVFTTDGEHHSIASDQIGRLTTRRASKDYNASVRHDIVFWSRFIAATEEPSFKLSLVRRPIRTTDENSSPARDAEEPSAEILSIVPTLTFLDSVFPGSAAENQAESPEDETLAEELEHLATTDATRNNDAG